MKQTNDNVLVTGGGGFLGKAIVRKLVQRGDRVTSFSRKFYSELKDLGVNQIQGDIGDKKTVENALKNVDSVYHVAAKAGVWGKKIEYFTVNVTGTENVIMACLKNKIPRLVYTSSPSVVFNGDDMEGVDESVPYTRHFNAPYPETKAIAEKRVRSAACNHFRTIILRPHLIWGPGDNHLAPGIIQKAEKLKKIGRGTNLVDTVYVENAADAHILACDKLQHDPSLSGNVYFISQDKPVNLWEMVDKILDAAGLPPVKGHVSARSAWFAGLIFEFIYGALRVDKEPPMTKFVAKELATSHWFDISKAKKDLGYSPAVSTEQGLEYLRNWFNSKRIK